MFNINKHITKDCALKTKELIGKSIMKNNKLTTWNCIMVFSIIIGFTFLFTTKTKTVFNTMDNTKKMLPIYSVDTNEKKIAISFDAAWGADDTDLLLDVLHRNNVKTTFFLCGYWIDKYPEEVKRIYSFGHDIGNHGNTHAHSSKLTLEENKAELLAVHKKIKDLLAIDIDLFRPPFGEYNNTVIQAANETNYHVVQWDVDSLDWKEYGTQKEIDHVLNHKNLANGSIILFHNDAKFTPEALEPIIKGLKAKGYEIVPISELIYKDNYYMDHTGRQKVKSN